MLRSLLTIAAMAVAFTATGCKSAPAPKATPAYEIDASLYPTRPNVAEPSFKVFHHDTSSITLVTKENATDDEIESIIWELRGAAKAHNFDKLGINQKWVDARDPMMWFHIYRGPKCASEKYAGGAPPCGGSYHAAGEYTLGGFTNRDRDDGVLLQGEDKQTQLWDPDGSATATKSAAANKQDAKKQEATR
jgi:hypothetical protein